MSQLSLRRPSAPSKFFPPLPHPFVVGGVQRLSTWITRFIYKLELEVAPEDVERLRSLSQQRLILFPNHPTFREPVLLYTFSDRVRQPFYFLAAYELFSGPMSRLFQWMGVYSIRRGLVDRASIKCTVDLLKQSGVRLVVFAEGRCSFQNDRLMPFQSGGVQLAFQALAKLAKEEGEAPDLYALPVAIAYRYKSITSEEAVAQTLAELETALGLKPERDDAYQRLRAIAQTVISQIEADYADLELPQLAEGAGPEDNWNERIARLRTRVLVDCETRLGLKVNENQPVRDRAYRIQAALRELADSHGSPSEGSLSQGSPSQGSNARSDAEQLVQHPLAEIPAERIKISVERLLNLDAIYDGYVAENPTPERFLDTLARFQREVLGCDEPPPKGIRIARLVTGEPLNLRDWFEEYQSDRNGTVDRVTEKIRSAVQIKLDQLVAARSSSSRLTLR